MDLMGSGAEIMSVGTPLDENKPPRHGQSHYAVIMLTSRAE